MAIMLSREAALKVIEYSKDTRLQLLSNANILDNNVNAQFEGLNDPSVQKYVQLSEQMHNSLNLLGAKLEEIENYCQRVIRFIDEYYGF